jgi:flagellin
LSLYVNTNLDAQNALDNLRQTDTSLSTAMQRLSSGLRINSAADDVAGYAIVQGMTGQLNGVNQAEQNSQDGVSLVQTAQGALSDVTQMLQVIRELAVQYSNGTNSAVDQQAIVSEVDQLCSEIERVGQTSQFNGIDLLNQAQTITFQVGANDGEQIAVATISLGAIASVASAFGSSASSGSITGSGLSASGFTEAQIQTAYEAAFASVFGPNNSATAANVADHAATTAGQAYGAHSGVGAYATVANNDSFGDGSTFGNYDTFGNNVVFGNNVAFGDYENFGTGDVFGTGDTFGNYDTFGDENAIGQNNTVGTYSTLGNNDTTGTGFSAGQYANTGTGDVSNANNNDTNWPVLLTGVDLSSPSELSVSGLDSDVSTFMTSLSVPSGSASSFITAFNSQLASIAAASGGSSLTGGVDISQIDTAINNVSAAASTFGAVQDRLSYTLANNSTYAENLTSATSRIQDTDMAAEMSSLTMDQVLQQAGTAILAQANHEPQAILTLING